MYFAFQKDSPRQKQQSLDQTSDASTESEQAQKMNACYLEEYSECYKYVSYQLKIKRSLCRNFTETGFCPYGSKCQFAHGSSELRTNYPNNHQSYKTKYCLSFLNNGYCSYGPRCNFIHKMRHQPSDIEKIKWKNIYSNFREQFDLFEKSRKTNGSKVLRIIQQATNLL